MSLWAFLDGLVQGTSPHQKNSFAALSMNHSRCLFVKLALQLPANEFVEVPPCQVASIDIKKFRFFLLEVFAIAHIPEKAIKYQSLLLHIYFIEECVSLTTICCINTQFRKAMEFDSVGSSLRHEFLSTSQLHIILESGYAPSHDVMITYQTISVLLNIL